MSVTDAMSRISQIQSQIESIQTAFQPSTATGTPQSAAGAATPATSSSAGAGSTTFANALAQAQLSNDSLAQSALGSSATSTSPTTSLTGTAPTSSLASALAADSTSSAIAAGGTSSALAAGGTSTAVPTSSTDSTAPAGTLPASAQSMLTSDQQQFAAQLAGDTGLDPGVISSWLLAEESGSAAQSRQGANNNDWLNIGYTDSATYGASDSVWSDPTSAADATAGWLKGQNTIPGYGTASSGIQAILGTAGQSPAAQIAALQQSGWASSGYPDLPTLYQQVTA